jgi:serine/threonine protein phosphatase 1
MSRTPAGTVAYAIGDIHGRLDLLVRMHGMIEADAGRRASPRRVVVYLGDYVSRGPDSRGVVDRVMDWLPPGFERVTLKGNHEDLMLRTHGGEFEAGRHWLDYGGIEALASYGVTMAESAARDAATVADLSRRLAQALPAPHLAFLRGLGISHREGDYYFVHGGIRPGIALEAQSERDCIWIRKTFLDSEGDHGAVVVHGHSIRDQVEFRRNRIGLDTGAYRSGMLSCLVLEGDQANLLQTAQVEGGC